MKPSGAILLATAFAVSCGTPAASSEIKTLPAFSAQLPSSVAGRSLDPANIPVGVIPPSSEGLNCGLNITSTRWIDLSGGIHNEHLSRTRSCGRRSGDDSMCHLCAGQDY